MAAILKTLTRQETWDLYNQIKDVDSETLKATIERVLLEHEALMWAIKVDSLALDGYADNEERNAKVLVDSSHDMINHDQAGEEDSDSEIEDAGISTSVVQGDKNLLCNPETGDFEIVEESKGLMDSIAKYFDLNLKLKYILEKARLLSDPSSGFFDVISIVAPAIAQQYAGIPALIIVAAVTVFCRNNISGTDLNI